MSGATDILSTSIWPRADRESAAVTAVTQLILRERQGRDRGWWEQMRDCFLLDSSVDLSWFSGSGHDFVAGSEARFGQPKTNHRMSAPIVYAEGGRAVAEAPAAIDVRFEIAGIEAELVSFTRLLYRVEQADGVWRIRSLTAIYERDTLTPVVPGTALELDVADLARYREPFRFLAYHLHSLGGVLGADLHGDDRPEQLAELYLDARNWLVGAGVDERSPTVSI